MNEVYLIDGYNIIGAMGDKSVYSLSHARDRLIDMAMDFAGYTQIECVLVFDGHKVHRGRGAQYTQTGSLTVIYTKEDETADMYIERETALRVRRGQTVRVCTNDALEQHVVLGGGGLRMTAQELLRQIAEVQRSYRKEHIEVFRPKYLYGRLDERTRSRLERLRVPTEEEDGDKV